MGNDNPFAVPLASEQAAAAQQQAPPAPASDNPFDVPLQSEAKQPATAFQPDSAATGSGGASNQDPATQNGMGGDPVSGGVAESAASTAGGLLNAIKNPVSTVLHMTPLGDLSDSIKQSVSLFDAYEKARAGGASVGDAMHAANQQAQKQDAAVQNVKARIDEFKKAPGQATVRMLADVAQLAAGIYGGAPEVAAEAAPEAAAEEGADATASQPAGAQPQAAQPAEAPSSMQKIGDALTQSPEQAEEAASGPKVIQALRDFAGDTTTGPIRKALDKPIADTYAQAKAAYKAVDDAAGTDLKKLYDNLDDANEDARNSAPGSAEEARAEANRSSIMDHIEDAKEEAKAKGVDNLDARLKEADGKFQQAQALKDVRKQVYNNQNIIKGNSAHGVSEFAKVNNAIDTVEKLDAPNKFGSSRIAQTPGGADSVFKLKQALYDAQTEGLRAAARQQTYQLGKRSFGMNNFIDVGHAIKTLVTPK